MKENYGFIATRNEKGVRVLWEGQVHDANKMDLLLAIFRGEFNDIVSNHKCDDLQCEIIKIAKNFLEAINYEINSLEYKMLINNK